MYDTHMYLLPCRVLLGEERLLLASLTQSLRSLVPSSWKDVLEREPKKHECGRPARWDRRVERQKDRFLS